MSVLGFLSEVFDPAGESAPIRRAATAWRDMDRLLKEVDSALAGGEAAFVAATWTGQDRDAYFRVRRQDRQSRSDSTSQIAKIAGQLDSVAQEVDSFNEQLHLIEATLIASIVVDQALSLFTFGAAEAAAPAEVAAATAEVGGLVVRLASFFRTVRTVLETTLVAVRPFVLRYTAQYRIALAMQAATGTALRWTHSGDPLAGWTSLGLRETVLGSALGAAFAAPMDMPFTSFLRVNPARPWLPAVANMTTTAVFGLTYRVLDGVYLRREDLGTSIADGGLYSLFIILLAGGISFTYGRVATTVEPLQQANPTSRLLNWKPTGRYYLWQPSPAKNGLVGAVILGVGGSIYPPVSPFSLPPGIPIPGAPRAGALVPPSRVLPVPAPEPPSNPPGTAGGPARGGGARLVHQGDTLWSIAGQAYGDPRLWPVIAQANNLSDPDLIDAGQTLLIPRLTLPELGPPPHR